MSEYLGPEETWPPHPRPEARAALAKAREAGWWFKPATGHTFGRLRCRRPAEDDPNSPSHKVPIFSSSGTADGSATARKILDALRACDHHAAAGGEPAAIGLGVDPGMALWQVNDKLRVVVGLLVAAEGLVASDDSLGRAEDTETMALDLLDGDPDASIDRLDAERMDFERQAREEVQRAYSAAARVGANDPWPPPERGRTLLRSAQTALAEAAQLLSSAAGAGDTARLTVELDRVTGRVRRLEARLQGLTQ